ncbi:hypothetical protein XBLMG947_3830 [Xanthomonas bromi]|uniref:Uncharacterized protein n=1 Tax=Xanthomonas bromi TaxID=56449 RepID=A0A1C3NRK7_9XANT|nr:hypothetical protein XBLMG947_3830 [Xanthomonas bromi]
MAAARLRRASGIAVNMPRSWYAERLQSGEISEDDLQAALQSAPVALRPPALSALKQAVEAKRPARQAIPTVAELAFDAAAIDWPGIVNERIGHWAAGYFDQGQALSAVGQSDGAYSTWRIIATHDLTPEIAGLAGFARSVADAPANAKDAIVDCVVRFGLSLDALDGYFHRLLTTLGGWGQLAGIGSGRRN